MFHVNLLCLFKNCFSQVNEAVSQKENTDKLEWMQRQVMCEGLSERLVFNSLTNTLGPRKLLHTGVLHKVCIVSLNTYFAEFEIKRS